MMFLDEASRAASAVAMESTGKQVACLVFLQFRKDELKPAHKQFSNTLTSALEALFGNLFINLKS